MPAETILAEEPTVTTQEPVLKARHRPWQTAGKIVTVLVGVAVVAVLALNENFDWPTVGTYLFDPRVLAGIGVTLMLTVVAMLIGIGLGIVLAVMRLSSSRFLREASGLYIWLARGIPVLLQLILWYNLAALFPATQWQVPFLSGVAVEFDANKLISPFTAAILGLGLSESAYMAEIVRGGILAVDAGQMEAGRALGMARALVMRRVVLPQAMRVIVPPTGNEVITMLKSTSLVSVIALADLLYSVQRIYAQNYRVIPLLIVASAWYLVMTSVLTFGQMAIERRLGRGYQSSAGRGSVVARWFRTTREGGAA